MVNIGTKEIIVVVVILIILFYAKKIPDLFRSLSKTIKGYRNKSKNKD